MPDEATEMEIQERAQRLFKEYYASCFWHMKPDLTITEAMIPVVVKGLRKHGGRKAFLAADLLEKKRK